MEYPGIGISVTKGVSANCEMAWVRIATKAIHRAITTRGIAWHGPGPRNGGLESIMIDYGKVSVMQMSDSAPALRLLHMCFTAED
jgi:hypothetical protein